MRAKVQSTSNDATRFSRAGDRFHYIWAARQCLELIDPNSTLEQITIEGSLEPEAAGEYVIDVGKLFCDDKRKTSEHYFQLKHSVARVSKAATLSELKKTLRGFAARFRSRKTPGKTKLSKLAFSIVSNRPVSKEVKTAILNIGAAKKAPPGVTSEIRKVTGLSGTELQLFCAAVSFQDHEGDYLQQERELKKELAGYVVDTSEDNELLALIALVTEHTLPTPSGARKRGVIVREDVLKRLGANHPRDLFPAPLAMESIENAFLREQHREIVQFITQASKPVILHAPGGVGKSVVARQLALSFPKGSVGLVYDCFGGGNYLNESQPRHRPSDALTQMANELALKSLCRTLVASASKPPDAILRQFLERLGAACTLLRLRSRRALLVLLIDAADNAEMAAEKFGDPGGFAQMLIREAYPANCRIVFLCRTERRGYLKAPSFIPQMALKPFSLKETLCHLKSRFSSATSADANEFHRLTTGNPRVQANSLSGPYRNVRSMLISLGPHGMTVDQQIAAQLEAAVARLQDQHTAVAASNVQSICRGLATLPPFIPIPVLAAAAGVDADTVKSFVSDLGRPLWHSDEAVQFRDEPVETWFRETFAATGHEIGKYAEALEPLAASYTYVARALPALWHRAGDNDRLIALSLSDKLLPEENPIDAREVRLYRLHFALKTALSSERLADAAKVALRAGEEMAGNKRQLSLFKQNTDLMGALQDPHRIQEIAYKRMLKGGWIGSEHAYAASLLSSHRDFHGEARSYLDAAFRWLQIHFEERDKLLAKEPHYQDTLTASDIAELAWSLLQLAGPNRAAAYLCRWKPPSVVFDATSTVVRHLVDAGRLDEISKMALSKPQSPHFVMALTNELVKVSKFPPKLALKHTLESLAVGEVDFEGQRPGHLVDYEMPAIASFAEACAHHQLSKTKVCGTLKLITGVPRAHRITSDFDDLARHTLARALSLQAVLRAKTIPRGVDIYPERSATSDESSRQASERREARRILDHLMALYFPRARMIANPDECQELNIGNLEVESKTSPDSDFGNSRLARVWDELPEIRLSLLALKGTASSEEIAVLNDWLKRPDAQSGRVSSRISTARICYRHSHLFDLGKEAELAAVTMVKSEKDADPDSRASWYVRLARTVLAVSKADSSAYFDEAIEAVSRFGDELLDRWDAVTQVARQAGEDQPDLPELTYRFTRCAEMVEIAGGERHWERADVFRVAIRLHAPSAFSSLSRWRERDIGHFTNELEELAIACVRESVLSPATAFCLTGFYGPCGSLALLKECLTQERSVSIRQKMFDVAVHDIYVEDKLSEKAAALTEVGRNANINISLLEALLERREGLNSRKIVEPTSPVSHSGEEESIAPFDTIFNGLDLASEKGLSQAISLRRTNDFRLHRTSFWSHLLSRVPRGKETKVLELLIHLKVEFFETMALVECVRTRWMGHASVRRFWPKFLRLVGHRFHLNFASRGTFEYLRQSHRLEASEMEAIKSGVQEGIAAAPVLLNSTTLFGFVSMLAKRLTPEQARDVLDYALKRFEPYIEPEFGDGIWEEWLRPPSADAAFTGLVWAALGAPDSEMRWMAAHCVRRLVEFDRSMEIASLLGWINRDGIAAFLGKGFPFYSFHARLYLVFGLARGAVENAKLMAPHAQLFSEWALNSVPHALLQPSAAKLALLIAKAVPSAVPDEICVALRRVGSSPYPLRRVEPGERNKFHNPEPGWGWAYLNFTPEFGMDFDAYWLPPLASVFGILKKDLAGMMQDSAVQDLDVPRDEQFPKDARQRIWNSMRSYDMRGTDHHHGSYPRVDNYTFYYSYHALMIAAARLLASMPVLERSSPEDDRPDIWSAWIERHGLARSDGRWICDRRDPTLPARLTNQTRGSRLEWLFGVVADDFFDVLTAQASIPGGLCVSGRWSDAQYSRDESITVSSALVRPEVADSLANSLRTGEHPGLETLLDETDATAPPFDLLKWIDVPHNSSESLESFDPHANKLSYPVRAVCKSVAEHLGLSTDIEKRRWRLAGDNSEVIVCEAWSDPVIRGRSSRHRFGERVFASVGFLKKLCATFDRELVVSVYIHRYEEREHDADETGFSYLPSSRKAFILSKNGILRDTTKDHHLG